MNDSDIIAAISTPPGESGIGIVRISGAGSIGLADSFINLTSYDKINDSPGNKLCHGYVVGERKNTIDEVLVSAMRAPRTYTAEDTIEINCHGGPIALRKTLELAIKNGARLAEPGEFTKRAFLNGRIDLTQAEAVAEIITAKSRKALSAATKQIKGQLSAEINSIRSEIIKVLANIEASVDFSDEEPEALSYKNLRKELVVADKKLKRLIKSYDNGRVLKEGILMVIAGPPNAGKSSILNSILKHERAIVTEIPGTTRDLIEETINIKGVPVIIRDTAGIRKPKDLVEKAGLNLTHESISQADLIILVLDGSKKDKRALCKMAKTIDGRKAIIVLNKKDLGIKISKDDIKKVISYAACVETSARFDNGIDDLEKAVNRTVYSKKISSQEVIVTNLRHLELLKKALVHICESKIKIGKEPDEVVVLFIREALEALDSITGKSFQPDLLEEIFSSFCLGK